MTYIYIAILIVVLVGIIPFFRNQLKKKRDYTKQSQIVHETKDKYSFLVDKNLKVKETNFYELNKDMPEGQTNVLGNVLHCQSGCDSGLCGTGISCGSCPVRMVLKNSFKMRRDFENIKANMHLYNANHEVQNVDVNVDGHFTYIGYEPHFVVNISKEL